MTLQFHPHLFDSLTVETMCRKEAVKYLRNSCSYFYSPFTEESINKIKHELFDYCKDYGKKWKKDSIFCEELYKFLLTDIRITFEGKDYILGNITKENYNDNN